jgi:hypothetical protein
MISSIFVKFLTIWTDRLKRLDFSGAERHLPAESDDIYASVVAGAVHQSPASCVSSTAHFKYSILRLYPSLPNAYLVSCSPFAVLICAYAEKYLYLLHQEVHIRWSQDASGIQNYIHGFQQFYLRTFFLGIFTVSTWNIWCYCVLFVQ